MQTFGQFLADAAQKGELVNTLFEERLFDLVGVLHRITDALTAERISHEPGPDEIELLSGQKTGYTFAAWTPLGLISLDVEKNLTAELVARLKHVRETE